MGGTKASPGRPHSTQGTPLSGYSRSGMADSLDRCEDMTSEMVIHLTHLYGIGILFFCK